MKRSLQASVDVHLLDQLIAVRSVPRGRPATWHSSGSHRCKAARTARMANVSAVLLLQSASVAKVRSASELDHRCFMGPPSATTAGAGRDRWVNTVDSRLMDRRGAA